MIPAITGISGLQFAAGLLPAAWYRYGVGLTDDGAGLCSAWADQSGNARHLAASGTGRPTIQADRSLLFDGAANFMRAAFTLNQPNTWYALLQQVTFTSGDVLLCGATTVARLAQAAATPDMNWSAGAAINITGEVVGSWQVFAGVFNSTSSSSQINNGTVTSGDCSTNAAGGVTLGAQTTGAANWANCAFKEVIVYAAAHDAATRARIIKYLGTVGALGL